ncbi:MAG: hypothetical protein HYT38_01435 [Candidatus Sungbacteria bacterium]|uniref:Glycosyltransferase RgtA/B/C/D-like domain-containing protein n=1 Tax=Candidatus Sungiibacteriota bacterium TaxID=2750080 RepID=A0A9D6HSL3_9BACT|nr:hypothetical protein [Candidatus Sungbacteria bacterium]
MFSSSAKPYFILLLIILLGVVLRFYHLPQVASFDFDQEYAANFAYSVIREYPLQLIGQGLSVQGLFMGPGYFYYLVPFFFLFNLSPLGGFVGSVALGLVTIFVYFMVVRDVFGTKTGLIAALFRACLFSKVMADWTMTPAFSVDLIILPTIWCFRKLWLGKADMLICSCRPGKLERLWKSA